MDVCSIYSIYFYIFLCILEILFLNCSSQYLFIPHLYEVSFISSNSLGGHNNNNLDSQTTRELNDFHCCGFGKPV